MSVAQLTTLVSWLVALIFLFSQSRVTAFPVNDVPGPASLRAMWRELQSALSDFWWRWAT